MNQNLAVFVTIIALVLAGCGEQRPKEVKEPVVQEEKPMMVEDSSSAVPAQKDTGKSSGETALKETPSKPSTQKGVTIVGEVIDLVSYATSGTRANTPAGKEIVLASAGGGNPLGLLEQKTGDVYVVTMKQANTSANQTLLPWVGMEVMAKGDVYRKGGQQLLVMTVIGKKAQ